MYYQHDHLHTQKDEKYKDNIDTCLQYTQLCVAGFTLTSNRRVDYMACAGPLRFSCGQIPLQGQLEGAGPENREFFRP